MSVLGVLLLVAAAGAYPAGGIPEQQKKEDLYNYLLFGTVFTERNFSLAGAEVAVRRAGEKKVRWRSTSDVRGEFAIRVPHGAEYEIAVTARGYQAQTLKVDARQGDRKDMVFHMKPETKEKKDEKKPQ